MASSKVALVTGSGKRRVGWHVAQALAKRGYAIAVHYHSSAAEAEDTVHHFKHLGVDAAAFGACKASPDRGKPGFDGMRSRSDHRSGAG